MNIGFKGLKKAVAAVCIAAVTVFGQSGETGTLTWSVSGSTLTISGAGDMPDYDFFKTPWDSYNSTITDVVIGNSVTSIGENAFRSNFITSISIPNSVIKIGSWAFSGSWYLTSVNIPASVVEIGEMAFGQCSKLTSINVEADNNNFASVGGVLFNKAKTTLIQYPGGKTETTYTIPASVIEIGKAAFRSNLKLASVVIPNSVNEIGESAFTYCSNLTSVEIPNSVTKIGKDAFGDCSKLTSIELPNSITEISDHVFSGCGLTSIDIPNSVTKIGSQAFQSCIYLTSVKIPISVTEIDGFEYCIGLTEVIIPNSVTKINGFDGCTGLTKVVIPNSVTRIGMYAFKGCTGLTEVVIPNAITYIGTEAFSGCTGLVRVISRHLNPSNIPSNAFKDVAVSTVKLYVPAQALDTYKNTAVVKDFDIQAMPFILDNTSITLAADATKTLEAEFDEEYTGNKTITWSSGNPAIVSVSSGTITAKANGTAIITATAGDFSDYCVVSVGKTDGGTHIISKTAPIKQALAISFAGIRNGEINLNLKAGNYTAELYNLQGRLVSSVNISAINGLNATGIKTSNLSKGMFILNVKQAGAAVLKQKVRI